MFQQIFGRVKIENKDTFIYLWHASTKIGGVYKSNNFYPWHVSTILVAMWGNATFDILNDNDTFIYLWHAYTKIGHVYKSKNFCPYMYLQIFDSVKIYSK